MLVLKKKIKLYATVHNSISMEKKSFASIRNKLMKYLDKYIVKTIVVSKEAENDYIETVGICKEKTMTIYNPVISDKIYSLQKESVDHKWLTKNKDFKTLVAAGRLTEQKNYPLLLESIKILSKDINIRLIILGDGELKNDLVELTKMLKIDDIVDFVGFTENPYKYFYNCDTYVMSSNWEGLPTVLIEAIACGCNIVSTECKSGPKEILDNGRYGILTPINNREKLAEAIKKSLYAEKNIDDKLKKAKEFTIEKSIKSYLKILNE